MKTTQKLKPSTLTERGSLNAGGTSDPTPQVLTPAFSETKRAAIVMFADEIVIQADALSRTDVESAHAVQKLAGLIVDVCEGRAGASVASAGDLRGLAKEKDAALQALENMTRACRLASLERDAQQTLAATYRADVEGLKTERAVLHLVLSPMPPQTIIERAEELVCQVRGVRSLARRYEEDEAQRVRSIDATANQDGAWGAFIADQDAAPRFCGCGGESVDQLNGGVCGGCADEDEAGEAAPS